MGSERGGEREVRFKGLERKQKKKDPASKTRK
jgi:hypothetical protein